MDENTRFRRALKNPLAVVGLCILAGLTIYQNVMESTLHSSLPYSIDTTPLQSVTTQAMTTSSSSVVHDKERTRWIEHPKRDPFAPITLANWSNPTSERSSVPVTSRQKPDQPSPKKLILKAVAIKTQQRSAVINRQVVYEGEMIEDYQVVSIQLQGVWLTRQGKREFLTFATNTTS